MFKDIPAGDVWAILCACVAVFNPLRFFPSLAQDAPLYSQEVPTEATSQTSTLSDVVLITVDWLPSLGDFTVSWGEATQFVGLVLGVVSFAHAVYAKKKGKSDED